jgi:BirA family biotin operon repressor/biotin-[acetyl-CoA-carboxylase] ligase
MSVKEEVVTLFEKNRGSVLSGEEIAERLGVSRTAVWKAIRSLQQEGYQITGVSGKGYCLSRTTDVMSASGILNYLDAPTREWAKIEIYDRVDSTNEVLKRKAAEGPAEGLVAAAMSQTKGKGRFSRGFYSPEGAGVYFSIYLKPAFSLEYTGLITTAAAVAACRAIDALSGKETRIKWVNDVYLEDRKVVGILTEASFNAESAELEYAVLGIGIDLYQPAGGLPPEAGQAGWIFDSDQEDMRNRMIAEVLNRFRPIYENLESRSFIDEYRRRCFVPGREVMVIRGGEQTPAQALEVDDFCRLKVRYRDGREEVLNSGEVSLKV